MKTKHFHLKMLVHFVGDLHQPMHIGQKEDKGGNTFKYNGLEEVQTYIEFGIEK